MNQQQQQPVYMTTPRSSAVPSRVSTPRGTPSTGSVITRVVPPPTPDMQVTSTPTQTAPTPTAPTPLTPARRVITDSWSNGPKGEQDRSTGRWVAKARQTIQNVRAQDLFEEIIWPSRNTGKNKHPFWDQNFWSQKDTSTTKDSDNAGEILRVLGLGESAVPNLAVIGSGGEGGLQYKCRSKSVNTHAMKAAEMEESIQFKPFPLTYEDGSFVRIPDSPSSSDPSSQLMGFRLVKRVQIMTTKGLWPVKKPFGVEHIIVGQESMDEMSLSLTLSHSLKAVDVESEMVLAAAFATGMFNDWYEAMQKVATYIVEEGPGNPG